MLIVIKQTQSSNTVMQATMKHYTGVLLLLNCMPLQVGLDIKVSIQIAIRATKCFGFEVVPDFGPRAAKRRTGYNITNQSKPGWSKLCESPPSVETMCCKSA